MTPLNLIHEIICYYYNVDYMYPFNKKRSAKTIYIRQMFHYISRRLNGFLTPYKIIGDYLSDIKEPINHATVINSCRKIEGYLTYDKNVIKDVENILKIIENADRIKFNES